MSVTVYTKSSCAPCQTLKMWLSKKGIAYQEKNVEDPANLEEMLKRTGNLSVPQTLVDEQVVSGPNFGLLSKLIMV